MNYESPQNGKGEPPEAINADVKKCSAKSGELQRCSYCQHSVELVWVHGHYQCPNCKHVVISCCGDS